MVRKPVLVVHGGAGSVSDKIREHRQPVLKEAAQKGFEVLNGDCSVSFPGKGEDKGGISNSAHAVETAVRILEDSPYFNAGTGSVLTLDGEVEMDAAIMDTEGVCGAVTCIQNIQNPISVARLVSRHTDHVLLTGGILEKLIKAFEIPSHNPKTERRWEKWRTLMDDLEDEGHSTRTIPDPEDWGHAKSILRELRQSGKEENSGVEPGTVGAVAIDRDGHLASATSTGGTSYKLPGRIGDTPLIGAGTLADKAGAVSATGDGEGIIRTTLSSRAVSMLEEDSRYESAESVAEETIAYASSRNVNCGVILLDSEGTPGSAFNTDSMDVVISSENGQKLVTGES